MLFGIVFCKCFFSLNNSRHTVAHATVQQIGNLPVIPKENIQVQGKIGAGAFGAVYKYENITLTICNNVTVSCIIVLNANSTYRGLYQGTTPVALKQLSQDTNWKDFENEAKILQV